jgi:surface protein
MSVIGGQNTPSLNGLAYIIDFNNNYTSGSSTVTPILYLPTASQFTGSVPNLINGQIQFTGSSVLRSFQNFPGFNPNTGNLTIMFSGEVKNNAVLFTQDGQMAVVGTTSSIGYGVPAGNVGRNFPNTGFDHVTLRFSTASVDCFVNGIPVSASGIFPTVPSSSVNTDFKIGGNFISAWTGSLSGSLGQLMVYTRPLSDDEIYSNYLIQARRYGLPEIAKPYTVDSSVYVYTQAAGITDTVTLNALNTFVQGLRSASLWDKMVAIYPFIGTNPSASRLNLKDVSLNTTQVNYSGSWSTSLSGSRNNNTSSYGILSNIKGDYVHPLISSQSIHLSYLSYDTPASGGYLMGVEQLPGLPGDIATPAAAYSVRKVRTAYTGSAMTVRRDFDDVTFDVGFDASGNLNTGSLITNMTASGIVTTLPGDYLGLAAAYSLRRVSSSYSGYAIEARRAVDNYSASIGFDASGNLNTASLASFIRTGSETPISAYSGLAAAYSLRKVVPGYTGSAIEVQSGSVSQSIGFNSFGDLDVTAIRTFAGSGDAFVRTWFDQSGNNRHATQSIAASQPQIYLGISGSVITDNGKPTVYFNSKYLITPHVATLPVSVFHVFTTRTGEQSTRVYLGGNGFTWYIVEPGSRYIDYNGVGGIVATPALVYNRQYSHFTLFSGSISGIGINDNTFTTRATSTTSVGSITIIGAGNTAGSNTLVNSYISEILLYNTDQTSNRTFIQNNINSYYGIYTPSSVSTENAFVKTWYDQSGNNNHATQSLASSQPLIIVSGSLITSSNKPAISFDGVGNSLETSFYVTPSFPLSIVSTLKTPGKNGAGIVGFGTAGALRQEIWQEVTSTGNLKVGLYGDDLPNGFTGSVFSNTPLVFTSIIDSAYRQLGYGNGINVGSYTGAGAYSGNQTFTIGKGRRDGLGSFMTGSIHEILVYSTNLTASRGLIEDNINGYYNIFTQSLASGSGYVTRWYDQSGNNRHVTQSTAGSQLQIVSSGSVLLQDNKPCLSSPAGYLTLSRAWGVSLSNPQIFGVYKISQRYSYNLTGHWVDLGNSTSANHFLGIGGDSGAFVDIFNSARPGYGTFNATLGERYLECYENIGTTTTRYLNTINRGSNTFTPVTPVTLLIGGSNSEFPATGNIQEIIIYATGSSLNRQPIEQNINSYFNIYTPEAYNLNTNSLSLFSSPNTVAGAANNVASASFTTGGPLGLITVSRTGSSNYTLWKNKVPNRVAISASIPQTSSLFLNAANLNNALFSSSQNNIGYASVGAGLSDTEASTYYDLVNTFQTSLGRGVSNPNAFITTWDTKLTGSGTSNSSSIVLPLYGTQAITASWGDGTTSNISSSTQVERTHSYATPGIYTVTITGSGQGFQFNNGGDRNKLLDVGQWGSISGSTTSGFYGCANLVGTAPDPHVLQTTSLSEYLRGTTRFNGYIGNWNTSNITNTFATFFGTNAFNQDLGSWNVNNISTFNNIFNNALAFNNGGSDSIKNWNIKTSGPVTMNAMFAGANFNQPIGSWNTSAVTNMQEMFQSTPFNQNIGSWNVSNVTSMYYMFYGNTVFNQNIGAWDVSKVTNMNQMFYSATNFNNSGSNTINNWRPISCSNFSSMFNGATAFNQPIGNWPISASSINMTGMFANSPSFNQNIGAWDVSKVTNMNSMFGFTTNFNNSGSNSINNWRPISCSNFSSMFYGPTNFNQPIGNWPLSASNINMEAMFIFTQAFNQDIGSWDMSRVTDIRNMFRGAIAFNNSGSDSINNWNISNITSTSRMFSTATVFNRNVGSWSVSNITDFSEMFYGATNFNNGNSPDISNWIIRTASAVNMNSMFEGARAFNQPIGSWDVSKVTSMASMFRDADAFNQDIGTWNLSSCTNLTNFMLDIPAANYSYLHTIYDGWINNKLNPNIQLVNFGGIKYSGSAAEGRALLTRTYNTASITGYSDDGGFMAITCSANHSVIVGNKVFISGSSYSAINGVETVLVAGSPTTLTLNTLYDPTATGGTIITGYGWSITDGGAV